MAAEVWVCALLVCFVLVGAANADCFRVTDKLFSYGSDTYEEDRIGLKSPLFGGVYGNLSGFDDAADLILPRIVGIRTIALTFGDFINTLQVTYVNEDGATVVGARHGKDLGSQTVTLNFAKNEKLVRVDGKYKGMNTSVLLLNELTFTTRTEQDIKEYGPYGKGDGSTRFGSPFSAAGAIVGFYGCNGSFIDAIGVVMYKPTSKYYWTPIFRQSTEEGGTGGKYFEDNPEKIPIASIINITVVHVDYILGFHLTYLLGNGSTYNVTHGSTVGDQTSFSLKEDEKIVQFEYSTYPSKERVHMLNFYTLDSMGGAFRQHGPFGIYPPNDDLIVRATGTIVSFFGSAYDGDSGLLESVGSFF